MPVKSEKMSTPRLRFPEFRDEWQSIQLSDFLRPALRIIPKPSSPFLAIGIRSHFKGTFQKPEFDPSKIEMEDLFAVEPNDLIVNITFAWEGAVAIVEANDKGGLVSHRFPTYVFNRDVSSSDFFRYVFPAKKFKYELELASPGGAGRNRVLNKKTFLEIKVNMPSTKEQQKITEFLTAVDEKISAMQDKIYLLKKYKKGVMQAIFSQKLRFKDDDENNFPDWEQKKLGGLGATYNGLQGKSGEDFGHGASYITYKQIFDNPEIDISKFGAVKIKTNERQNKVKTGDIFFTTSSETPSEVGFSSTLLEEVGELYLNSFCFGYRISNTKNLSPRFAKYLFLTDDFRKQVVRLAQGSTRYNISKTEFMKIVMQIPIEDEQYKIADFLTSLDDKIELESRKLEQAKSFKKALLQQMFV